MNIYRKIIFIVLIFISTFYACKKKDYDPFGSDAGVYYSYANAGDSLLTALFGYTDKDTIMKVYVKTYGRLNGADRKYSNIIDSSISSSALYNIDYTVNNNYIIGANKYMDSIELHIINHHYMGSDYNKYILMKLLPNENFDTLKYDGGATTIRSNYANLTIDYSATKPIFWDNSFKYLGTYSQVKLKTFIDNQNLDLKKVIAKSSSSSYSDADVYTAAYHFSQYLQQMADSGTPIKDGDGKPMQLGTSLIIHY